ncbi:uncharacterized protein PAN0_005c2661 [Moesziomyces antarcticus]|nr:uncharacterized protein PAN0_005c2661 [Moesziomyces antarcticus]GAK64447.1 hypothetical protein PAN0_005c2661 [Moesziomyces antarcticus]
MSSLGRCLVDGMHERSKTRTTYLNKRGIAPKSSTADSTAGSGRSAGGRSPAREISLAFPRHAAEHAHHAESFTRKRPSMMMRGPSLEEASCRDDGKTALGKSWSKATFSRAASLSEAE